jgi:hypothetical protein
VTTAQGAAVWCAVILDGVGWVGELLAGLWRKNWPEAGGESSLSERGDVHCCDGRPSTISIVGTSCPFNHSCGVAGSPGSADDRFPAGRALQETRQPIQQRTSIPRMRHQQLHSVKRVRRTAKRNESSRQSRSVESFRSRAFPRYSTLRD